MSFFFGFLLTIPFLVTNFYIILSDMKEKKIPNIYLRYLLFMLPFWYLYVWYFHIFSGIHFIAFLLQVTATILISFWLYHFWKWGAGDAKYLIVLCLYIPQIWIIPFIGNIALIGMAAGTLYFLWFYLGKVLFISKYRKSLLQEIRTHMREVYKVKKNNSNNNTTLLISKTILIFLLIFISIHLSRLYFLEYMKETATSWNIPENIFLGFNTHLVFILFLFIFFFVIRYVFRYIKNYIFHSLLKEESSLEVVYAYMLWFLSFLLLWFIILEFIINPYQIGGYLYQTFTIYLLLYIVTKILIFMYKICFSVSETSYININDLKSGDIVDKPFLIKMFWTQDCLWYIWREKKKLLWNNKKEEEKFLLYPDPTKYFQGIHTPIDKDTALFLKKIYKTVNEHHLKEDTKYQSIDTIKTYFSFAFWIYIFWGFIVTVFFWNTILQTLIGFGLQIFSQK